MTKRQKQVLDYIDRYIAKNGGVSPSQAEIAEHLLISQGAVWQLVQKLIEDKRLKFKGPRNYVVIK